MRTIAVAIFMLVLAQAMHTRKDHQDTMAKIGLTSFIVFVIFLIMGV